MSDLETARIIALNLLGGDSPPEEAEVRRMAEIAVQAVEAQAPGAQVDTEALVRELEANLNVVVGTASTLTDDTNDHLPWVPDRRASIEWKFTKRYQRFLRERRGWALPTLQRSDDLQLLGDELIASDRLTIFELVTNSYDADASKVPVRLNLYRSREPTVAIIDDGEGMTLNTIRSVWLALANEHRKDQRESQQRTPKSNRLPLGEKGVGRFAVNKLRNRIQLVTRARDADESPSRQRPQRLLAHATRIRSMM